MTAVWTPEDLQNAVQNATTRAVTDPAYRKILLENPTAALKEITGKDLPDGFALKVLEVDPSADATILLPPLQTDALSDQELDQAAGGRVTRSPYNPCPGYRCILIYL